MTDKQLKKLSRLEVLELLLEQTKINEQLRAEIAELENELSKSNRIAMLDKLAAEMQSSVETLNRHTKKIETLFESSNTGTESNAQIGSEKNNNELRTAGDVHQVTEEYEKADVKRPAENKITINEKNRYSNINLYSRLMYFYYKNENALSILPEDIQRDVREKLKGILNGEKK